MNTYNLYKKKQNKYYFKLIYYIKGLEKDLKATSDGYDFLVSFEAKNSNEAKLRFNEFIIFGMALMNL